MARNPSPKVFGGPLDGSDRLAPIYYFDAANRPYILATEVAVMVERLGGLPARRHPEDQSPRMAPAPVKGVNPGDGGLDTRGEQTCMAVVGVQ